MKLNYRADIDGLRAIAVLAVVLNHAGIALFPGGFIGVDVFFVISGYLITNIIVREIDAGEFFLARFYERRIRRIYPALFAFIPFTILASAILYNADNFLAFGKSVIATTFFVSNVHFWTETGYFEGPAQLKPLLHTWSLAVEEQYYILFPPLMLLLARYFKPKIAVILSAIAALSFGAGVYTVYYGDPSTAFYLAHTRIWELLTGCILALSASRMKASPAVNNGLSLAGFAMIAIPIFSYSKNTPFPGLAAALPVFGAALIIFSGINGTTVINKLLSLPPLVFVGQISYSLYLWHWSLVIFGKYYAIKSLTPQEIAGLLLVIFIISTLSWHFVEKPFREKRALKGRNIFIYAAAAMSIAAAAGFIVVFNNGFPDTRVLTKKETREWSFKCKYIETTAETAAQPTPCKLGAKKAEPSFLLWGDSFGRALVEGVSLSASKYNLKGQLLSSTGCAPLLGIARSDLPCVTGDDIIIQYIKDHPELETVILTGRWALWAEGSYYNSAESKTYPVVTDTLAKPFEENTPAAMFERGLERTIVKLYELDRKVVIINQVPEIGYDVPSVHFIAQRTGRDTNDLIAPTLDEYLQRNRRTREILDRLSVKYGIRIIDPRSALCNDTRCLVAMHGQALYMDNSHLSVFGSEYISYLYDPLFEELANQK